nr:hypothetical protein [uncultured Ottowia sp.]
MKNMDYVVLAGAILAFHDAGQKIGAGFQTANGPGRPDNAVSAISNGARKGAANGLPREA